MPTPTKQTEHNIDTRQQDFLVARRTNVAHAESADLLDVDLLSEGLELEGVEILETLQEAGGEVTFLCRMDADKADRLSQRFGNQIIVEPDVDLEMFTTQTPEVPVTDDPEIDFGLFGENEDDEEFTIKIKVLGDGAAIAGATVYLIGSIFPVKAVTDAGGTANLTLIGESPGQVRALYVKPRSGYWSLWIDNPSLNPEADNVITLRALTKDLPGFPVQEIVTPGHQVMGFSDIASSVRGSGIRIGVIDSGLATAHPDLGASHGRDLTDDSDPENSWRNDTVGHGTHVTGTIAALANELGIHGFAPEAEVHVFKVFPGGKLRFLLKALSGCVTAKVDLVNMSLGMSSPSELLQQRIQEARAAGVACIAAAGNSKGKVKYPASFPEVMAVAAIGIKDSFPADSYHQRQIGEHVSTDGRFFSAKFTCFGNEIDLCSPGVAVISSYPAGGYTSLDGTSMASPHVTGIAALLLQADTELNQMPRDANRVEALFSRLKDGCTDLGIPAQYQGRGMPTAKGLDLPSGSGPKPPQDQLEKVDKLLEAALRLVREYAEQR